MRSTPLDVQPRVWVAGSIACVPCAWAAEATWGGVLPGYLTVAVQWLAKDGPMTDHSLVGRRVWLVGG